MAIISEPECMCLHWDALAVGAIYREHRNDRRGGGNSRVDLSTRDIDRNEIDHVDGTSNRDINWGDVEKDIDQSDFVDRTRTIHID